MAKEKIEVAFFSPEFGFHSDMPNYAGGLGMLAADIMSSCADLNVPAVGVSLMYHQDEDPEHGFNPEQYMKKREETIEIVIENRKVKIVIWQMDVKGVTGHVVPIFFLSSNLPENECSTSS